MADDEPPRKRYRYESYSKQLTHIKVDTGKTKGSSWDEIESGHVNVEDETAQSVTPLTTALEDLSLLHLVIPYTTLTRKITPLTRTFPLTLHNLEATQAVFHSFFAGITPASTTESSGLDGVLVLYSKWYETITEEGVGYVVQGAKDLLRIGGLNGLQAVLIEKTYSTLSAIFKTMASSLVSYGSNTSKSHSSSTTSEAKDHGRRRQILQELWTECAPYLSTSVKPHVRACVAQAWAVILRRARGEVARDLIEIMVEGLVVVGSSEGEDERSPVVAAGAGVKGVAGALSESMKGSAQLLHSRATQLYTLLMQHLLGTTAKTSPDAMTTTRTPLLECMVLLTTSLIHHSSATAMAPIHGLVIRVLNAPITESPPPTTASTKPESFPPPALTAAQSTVALRLASTLVGVRKGLRLPAAVSTSEPSALQQYMHALVAWLQEIESAHSTPEWRIEYLRCVTACLVAGKLGDWLSPGVKLIDRLWEALPLAEKFKWTAALVGVKWKGVEQFVLHHVARTSVTSLRDHRLETVSLLAILAKNGFLNAGLGNVQGGRWKELLSRSVGELFTEWSTDATDDEENRAFEQPETAKCMARAFTLCSTLGASAATTFLQPMRALLVRSRKAATAMTQGQARESFASGPFSMGYVLAAGLDCLHQLDDAGVDGVHAVVQDVVGDGAQILRSWGWHRQVLEGLAAVRTHWVDSTSITVTRSLQDALSDLLLSQDSLIRTSVLQILSHAKQPAIPKARGSEGTADDQVNLYDLCLQVEEAGMSLQNVREKTTKIRKVEIALRDLDLRGAEEASLLNNLISYLISQLKVNFRPLYPDTIDVLATFATKYPAPFWLLAFEQLEKCSKNDPSLLITINKPSWVEAAEALRDDKDTADENVDKTLHCPNASKLDRILDAAMNVEDIKSGSIEELEHQIFDEHFDALNYETQVVKLLEKVPNLVEKHGRQVVPLYLAIVNFDSESEQVKLSQRIVQTRLANYLELFGHFTNPKALYQSEEAFAAHLDILAKGENKLQSLALSCVATYRQPGVLPYEERLQALLVDSKFRDALSNFPLGVNSEVIEPSHRPELMPVLLRILFGIMIARRGRNSSNQGPAARKHAILASLAGCTAEDLSTLVDLMLQPFQPLLRQPETSNKFAVDNEMLDLVEDIPRRTQSGFLSLLADVLKHLSKQIVPLWPTLLSTTVRLVAAAQRAIEKETHAPADNEEMEGEDGNEHHAGSARSTRTLGIRRLADFFKAPVDFNFDFYMPTIFASVISPRLPTLPQENTQSPSALMDIFSTWSSRPEMTMYLVQYDATVLPQLFDCLSQPKVKPAVVTHIMDLADRLLVYATEDGEDSPIVTRVIRPHVGSLLNGLVAYMSSAASKSNSGRDEIIKRQISILSQIAHYVATSDQARQIAEMLLPLLRRPGKQVPERVKADILTTLQALLPLVTDFADLHSTFHRGIYNSLASLFRSLYTRPARESLVKAFSKFATINAHLAPVLEVISDINAFSVKRMEEPDFDRRLSGYAHINSHNATYNLTDWIPLLHNFLFYIQDGEELTIRTNASTGLKLFIDFVIRDGPQEDRDNVLLNLLYPGLRNILNNRNELVRAEALGVLSYAVSHCSHIELFAEMQTLMAEDEESNVFNNIYHLQIHRRARALRRLVECCAGSAVREATINGVFVPIVGHIISGATEKSDDNLINEAVRTLGSLSLGLGWSRYQSLVLAYLRLATAKGSNQKHFVRAISAILDNFHFAMDEDVVEEEPEPRLEEDAEMDNNPEAVVDEVVQEFKRKEAQRIADYVTGRLLPALIKFVEQKDEMEDSIRIPVAVGVVKVARALPEESRNAEVTRTITVLSQILRSKDYNVRKLVKKTLSSIALLLGPEWLAPMFKELRASLQRGPQLHVLAFVIHAILVDVTSNAGERFAELDSAVGDVVTVSAEVIWGQSGRDVDAEGFKTKMPEVNGAAKAAYHSFELISSLISPAKISQVLVPLRSILHETQAVKPMQQVDDVLKSISIGLKSNKHMGAIELLRLCHTLINSNSAFLQGDKDAKGNKDDGDAKGAFKVQMKRKNESQADFYDVNSYKFVAFGLELFVKAFTAQKFDFSSTTILGRLSPLVKVIGNTLFAKNDHILSWGLRAMTAICKTPVPAVSTAMPIVLQQIIKIIKQHGGTISVEINQVAVKSLTNIIRHVKTAEIKESQLKYVLEVIGPDLEEHETQGIAFDLLRAVISRRFVVAEIYDFMERVSSIMVTSQSKQVQETCRSALLAFMLDYPQGKGRLKAQMTFLAQNLSYVYESGRLSVMELLEHVFQKFSEDLVAEYNDMFFLALVIVNANDDSEKCRTKAGTLLQILISRYDDDKLRTLVSTMSKWIEKRTDDSALARSAAIVAGLTLQAVEPEQRETLVVDIQKSMNDIIVDAANALEQAEEVTEEDMASAFEPEIALDYSLPYQALTTLTRCLDSSKELDKIAWNDVIALLLFPHDWVRLAAAKVIGLGLSKDAAVLDVEQLGDVARKCCLVLTGHRSKDGSRTIANEKLCTQVVKLLFFIGKAWAASSSDVEVDPKSTADDDNEDGHEPGNGDGVDAKNKSSLPWLMSRLSFVARNLIINRPAAHEQVRTMIPWTAPLAAVFQFFALMINFLPVERTNRYLKHVLSPIYRIADEEGDVRITPGDQQLERLYELSIEVRDLVQSKVGTTAFSTVWEQLRKRSVEKRGSRKAEQHRMAVADPEAYGRRKEQRSNMKQESKKRKAKSFADAKLRERPVKRRA
ncbi:hypothetical protein QFC19_002263 [Naganishia cerealis]|uniref:Uncharacterized protein n=1 Tax=Naganishia cerealis TaxID=610337 RepID=A0ACC2WA84_9TREE|nr:hypothetical protein QFC19_002263 [Naganishia cerealis]